MMIDKDGMVVMERSYKAVLVGVGGSELARSMPELKALSDAAGIKTERTFVQNLPTPNPRTYLGSGKLEELADICSELEIDTLIFNDELSSSQQRNIEDRLDLRVIDRTILILDIFASRANTREGKLQVELAQLQYRMSHLKGLGKTLSRLGGGIGTRGPGEKKLETDRRHILNRIYLIKKQLKEIEVHRRVNKKQRLKKAEPVVALVGYTNAGKSATMNRIIEYASSDALSKSPIQVGYGEKKKVLVENKLFATLDVHRRRIKTELNMPFILADTVGFVSKLPHNLVEAFKGTLEEVVEADLLLHIVDASFEGCDFQIEVVNKVLEDLGATDIESLLVYNKVDLIDQELKNQLIRGLFISAKTGEGIEELLKEINKKLFSSYEEHLLNIPYTRGELVSYLIENFNVISKEYMDEGTLIKVEIDEENRERFKEYIVK